MLRYKSSSIKLKGGKNGRKIKGKILQIKKMKKIESQLSL